MHESNGNPSGFQNVFFDDTATSPDIFKLVEDALCQHWMPIAHHMTL